MKRLLIISLVLLLCAYSLGTPISGTAEDSLGAFTGAGSEQDDNVKASLDLAHTDLDLNIADNEDITSLLGQSTGSVFYVDVSASGTTGVSWALAVNDLEEAVQLCTSDAGDIIFMSPGHTETVGGAGAIDIDKTGITIIGLGNGELRPTFTYDTNVDTMIIGADDITIRNVRFLSSVTAVASAIVVEANMENFIIEDCVFENEASTVDEFIDCILTADGSDGGIIRRNRWLGDVGANAGPKASINFIGSDFLQIYENEFSGDIGDAHIFNETTAGNYVTIRDNRIMCGYIGADSTNLDTTAGISLVATTTGFIQNNMVVTNVATPELAIVAADCYLSDNKYTETQGGESLDIGLEVGKTYVRSSATLVSAATDNIFTVAGGRIEIISLFGECTTLIGTVGVTDIYVDATAGSDYDADFCTAVDIDALGTGDTITFTDAVSEGVLTFVANNGAGVPLSWYCPAGILILDPTTTDTGGITWWMTFRPLEPGVTVTVGP